MSRRPDVFDISHHNGKGRDGSDIIDWDQVPAVPIVHKVNEGTFVDPLVLDRLPIIADRHERFGGYTVLIVSRSTIAEQVERFVSIMSLYWRAGACTQLDVEPWPQYPRPVDAGEIVEAHDLIERELGRAPAFYFNPRTMPGVLEQVRRYRPDIALWEPHYGVAGPDIAARNGAVLHQWTSSYAADGFHGAGIDANTILDPLAWDDLCGISHDQEVTVNLTPPGTRKRYDSRTTGRPLERGKVHRIAGVAPAGAAGAVVNVTVVDPEAKGYAVIGFDGPTPPAESSHVNFAAWDNRANAVTIPVRPDGSVQVWLSATAHLVLECQAVLR